MLSMLKAMLAYKHILATSDSTQVTVGSNKVGFISCTKALVTLSVTQDLHQGTTQAQPVRVPLMALTHFSIMKEPPGLSCPPDPTASIQSAALPARYNQ
jgi:hypothetical protein